MKKIKLIAFLFLATGFICSAQEENLKEREKQAAFNPTYTTFVKKKYLI